MTEIELLSFLEKDAPHNTASNYYDNTDDKTVYEVAVELEEKYQVVSKFTKKYINDIMHFIAKEKTYAILHPEEANKSDLVIANHIKGLWLDYMEKGEHGVISKRAIETGTVGLIDTGEYYQSMEIDYNGENSNAGLSYWS